MNLEAQRLENLRQKQKLLSELQLESRSFKRSVDSERIANRPIKKRKTELSIPPVRSSVRIASLDIKPTYKEENGEKYNYVPPTKSTKHVKKEIEVINDTRSLIPARDAEEIRAGWTQWERVADEPTRDEHGVLHFTDYPTFTPNKTPEEVIREGCFGGSYFRPLKSRKLGIVVENDWNELPGAWITGLNIEMFLTNPEYNPEVNKYKVACGQSIEEWEANGWIAYEYDIRGWFQWYCRFYCGRRCDDDERQVSRWKKCVGETGRWRRILLKKYLRMGVREVFDDGEEEDGKEVSPVIHQTCHHWAYEVRQDDLDKAWGGHL